MNIPPILTLSTEKGKPWHKWRWLENCWRSL